MSVTVEDEEGHVVGFAVLDAGGPKTGLGLGFRV